MKSTRGRPTVGPDIHLKLPSEVLATVDRLARDWKVSRSEAIRRLVVLALGR